MRIFKGRGISDWVQPKSIAFDFWDDLEAFAPNQKNKPCYMLCQCCFWIGQTATAFSKTPTFGRRLACPLLCSRCGEKQLSLTEAALSCSKWNLQSNCRFEPQTLVVETENFNPCAKSPFKTRQALWSFVLANKRLFHKNSIPIAVMDFRRYRFGIVVALCSRSMGKKTCRCAFAKWIPTSHT